jgi:hypothetical protein
MNSVPHSFRLDVKQVFADSFEKSALLMMKLTINTWKLTDSAILGALEEIADIAEDITTNEFLVFQGSHWIDVLKRGSHENLFDFMFQLEDQDLAKESIQDTIDHLWAIEEEDPDSQVIEMFKELMNIKSACFNKYLNIVREASIKKLTKLKRELMIYESILFDNDGLSLDEMLYSPELVEQTLDDYRRVDFGLMVMLSGLLSEE